MKHKRSHLARNLVAGGAALTVVSCAVAPLMLRAGIKAIKRAAGRYHYDLETGMIRPKDENVIVLSKNAYTIETQD